jgi:acetyl esterase/lipase
MKLVTTVAFAALLAAAPALAQAPDFAQLEASQNAANSKAGPRSVPARVIPVPQDVSAQAQALVGAPYRAPAWDANPGSADAWRTLVTKLADAAIPGVRHSEEVLGVTVQPATIGGVKAFILTPKQMPPLHQNQLIINVHGGGYVYGPGESGLQEAVLLCGIGGYKVIEFDYRMPPDAPYPAAMDDAMAVYRAALQMTDPAHLAIEGTSTGGGMTLAMILRAKAEGLPLPAAIAPGTPWADLTETGDSYRTNEWVDSVLVSYDGYLTHAAQLYANGHDLKDPQLSPIYGDFHGFPPTFLTTGTRDLFLSNTVRTQRKLRQAGVTAELNVFEGFSHAQYLFDVSAPETREAFGDIAAFFDRYLAQ